MKTTIGKTLISLIKGEKMKQGNVWNKCGGGPASAAILLWIFALLLVPLSAQAQTTPPELTSFFEFDMSSVNHEPALDDYGIPESAHVYGAFDSSYAAIPIPSAIRGYNNVDDVEVSALKPGHMDRFEAEQL